MPAYKAGEENEPSKDILKNALFSSLADAELVLRFFTLRDAIVGNKTGSLAPFEGPLSAGAAVQRRDPNFGNQPIAVIAARKVTETQIRIRRRNLDSKCCLSFPGHLYRGQVSRDQADIYLRKSFPVSHLAPSPNPAKYCEHAGKLRRHLIDSNHFWHVGNAL